MTERLIVTVCGNCGQAVFPPRALCPRCGCDRWHEQMAETGVVEEATEHRGMPIASVRTDAGPVVVARCGAPRGATVRLSLIGGAPSACNMSHVERTELG